MKRKITVFIASPSDLVAERNLFRQTIDALNAGFGDGCNVEFEALGWEDTLASTGRRNQGIINQDIDKCDVFILAMHRRWGQEAPDAAPYSSYTEEEFHRALERWKTDQKPEILVFFKRVDPASEADPGPQLQKVLQFKKQLEDTRQVLFRTFNADTDFAKEVDSHLRAFAKDELPKSTDETDIVVLPLAALEEVQKSQSLVNQKIKEAKAAHDAVYEAQLKIQAMQLASAQDAATLSKEGKVEFARQRFAHLIVESTDLQILFLAYEFYSRTGDLNTAFSVLEKWLNICGTDEKSAETAAAYGNLGVLYQTRGELDQAHDMYLKALDINQALGRKEGMANQYSNLGTIYKTRGEIDQAHNMYLKALEIDQALGNQEGMASDYGNLGILYRTRGELDQAHDMYLKALNINQALGNQEGMASDYGNLGTLYTTRGELDLAQDMYLKSLDINQALGRKEGMASNYGNLGNLHKTRGELDLAQDMYLKALEIETALGRKEGMASDYGNLGILYKTRGEHDKAHDMYLKALDINQALGRKEGMASDYGNLGRLYQTRGDLDKAREMLTKSLSLFKAIQSPNANKVSLWLKNLDEPE
jgi:tetratricopeptide (TPR) repeat protein